MNSQASQSDRPGKEQLPWGSAGIPDSALLGSRARLHGGQQHGLSCRGLRRRVVLQLRRSQHLLQLRHPALRVRQPILLLGPVPLLRRPAVRPYAHCFRMRHTSASSADLS